MLPFNRSFWYPFIFRFLYGATTRLHYILLILQFFTSALSTWRLIAILSVRSSKLVSSFLNMCLLLSSLPTFLPSPSLVIFFIACFPSWAWMMFINLLHLERDVEYILILHDMLVPRVPHVMWCMYSLASVGRFSLFFF